MLHFCYFNLTNSDFIYTHKVRPCLVNNIDYLQLWKHLLTECLDLDVQPTYIRWGIVGFGQLGGLSLLTQAEHQGEAVPAEADGGNKN